MRDRATGSITLRVQGIAPDSEGYAKLGTAVGYLLGPGSHDAMSGTYYACFLVKHTDHSAAYLRQTYRRATVHDDDTFVDKKTEWIRMMKFDEANAIGDGSRYLHDLSASMEASSAVREVPVPISERVVVNNYFWLHGAAPFKPHPPLHREPMRQRGTFAK